MTVGSALNREPRITDRLCQRYAASRLIGDARHGLSGPTTFRMEQLLGQSGRGRQMRSPRNSEYFRQLAAYLAQPFRKKALSAQLGDEKMDEGVPDPDIRMEYLTNELYVPLLNVGGDNE